MLQKIPMRGDSLEMHLISLGFCESNDDALNY